MSKATFIEFFINCVVHLKAIPHLISYSSAEVSYLNRVLLQNDLVCEMADILKKLKEEYNEKKVSEQEFELKFNLGSVLATMYTKFSNPIAKEDIRNLAKFVHFHKLSLYVNFDYGEINYVDAGSAGIDPNDRKTLEIGY